MSWYCKIGAWGAAVEILLNVAWRWRIDNDGVSDIVQVEGLFWSGLRHAGISTLWIVNRKSQ